MAGDVGDGDHFRGGGGGEAVFGDAFGAGAAGIAEIGAAECLY
jgi:hypothetical protein